ncbi:MAG: hypothetical protein E7496_03645 [Ruminococcus sp.]|nr:hypothetical protein [Ruminococcus sp.]
MNAYSNWIEKKDEVFRLLGKYAPEWPVKDSLRLVNSSGEELWIDFEDYQITIFFGDWHCHYLSELDEYQCFLEDLFDILENKKYIICHYHGDNGAGSCLSENAVPDETELRNDYKGQKIVCSFWDNSKNITYNNPEA